MRQEQIKRDREREKEVRLTRWNELAPEIFKSTDPNKLPNLKAFNEALSTPQANLLLHGNTARGKSRCAWELVRLAILKGGRYVRVLDSTAGIRFASRYSKSCSDVEDWLDELCECDLLLLDDVFKNKITEAFEGFIYSIIDQRTIKQKQIIVTCNDTGESLQARLSGDKGEPFIRRLREFCKPIQF
jgi:DNA replication protein DnaC